MRPLRSDYGPLVISARDVTKRFTGKPVFKPVSFEAHPHEIVAITGPNGVGKTTLLKMISQIMTPTSGACTWARGVVKLDHDHARRIFGYSAPYLELYAELTAIEHVKFIAEMKGYHLTNEEPLNLLRRFGLDPAIATSERRLGAYSSGMKQRVRSAMAFACLPEVLLLDEVTSNLDDEGTAIVLAETRAVAAAGAIIFIATNDARERAIAQREIRIEPY